MCGLGNHTLKYCPNIIEKVLNKKIVNLLQTIPKHVILNSKNLHVFKSSRARGDNNDQKNYLIQPIKNPTKYPYVQQQNKTTFQAVEFFTKEREDQRVSKDLMLEEFLELLKEEKFVTRLVQLLNMLKNFNPNREEGKVSENIHMVTR